MTNTLLTFLSAIRWLIRSLSTPPGAITGLFGPNGADKPSTLRTISGLSRSATGIARVDGREYVQH